ncbi:MAG: ribosome-associated translation inhibitor RaiA [Bacteroidia bacterium]|nr:ribosome-associated translation inhibitor RaiA [Bacteroidia bacterium]
MKITIQSIHFDAADRLKDYIQKKCDKLDQFFDRIIDGEVTLKVHNENKGGNKFVELKVNVPGDTLVASESGQTFEEATDLTTDKIKEQLRRYKGKTKGRVRASGS